MSMCRPARTAVLFAALAAAGPAAAGLREAHDAFAARDFATALAELAAPARAGNAEAEAMLGRLHGLGLGTPRDPVRGFDWTRRAAGRGLPSAQAHLAHLFETGTGLPAPDPLRAYLWYALAAHGGDRDAERDRVRLRAGLTAREISRAETLFEDHRPFLYPHR